MHINWIGKSSELKLHCFCLFDAYSMPKDIYSVNHQTLGQWEDRPSAPVYYIYWRLSDFYRFSYYRCNVLTTVDLRPSSNVIGNEEGPFLWFMILAFEGQFLQLLLVHLKSEDYFLTLYLYEEVSNVKKSQKFSLSAKSVYQDFAFSYSWHSSLKNRLTLWTPVS